MCDPGSADLSADVDFSFLKQAILQGSGMSQRPIKGNNPKNYSYSKKNGTKY